MKIIFSRKGYDSSYKYDRGYSPIFPDGDMLSMPIPASGKDATREHGILLGKASHRGNSFNEITKTFYKRDPDIIQHHHFDPDLNAGSLNGRHPEWRGAFGQTGAAQSHLKNQVVKEGDLFLFFGNFRHTEMSNQGDLKWKSGPCFHALFGYLCIDKILCADDIEKGALEDIYKDHPHFMNRNIYGKTNALYIAKEHLDGSNLPGSGTFFYDDQLRLTEEGSSASFWKLPTFFHHEEGTVISRHGNVKRYERMEDYLRLQTVGIGQDFVVSHPTDRMKNWAMNIVQGKN